jgi:hypothetical protein
LVVITVSVVLAGIQIGLPLLRTWKPAM